MKDVKRVIILIVLAFNCAANADGVERTAFYEQLIQSKKSELKDKICSGSKSRYTHKAIVTFYYPKVAAGTPIDEAAKIKKDRLDLVRNGLALGYFSHNFNNFDARQEKEFRQSVVIEHDPILESLTEGYTFRIPISVLKKVFKLKDPIEYQHRGYDYTTLAWKASKAISDRDTMWNDFFYRMTSVAETAKSPDTVVFTLSLDFNLFCNTGIAINDLVVEGVKNEH